MAERQSDRAGNTTDESAGLVNYPAIQWVSKNLGVVTVLVFMLGVVRLFFVSHFSTTTALALLESAGPTLVVLAALISFLPDLLAMFAVAALIELVDASIGRRLTLTPGSLLLGIVLLVAVTLTPWPVLVIGILAAVIISFVRKRQPGHPTRSSAERNRGVGLFLVVLLVVFLFRRSVWLPAEKITLANGRQLVAYVVGEEAGWITMLTDVDRRILRLRPAEVDDRQVCSLDEVLFSRSSSLLGSVLPDYPPCVLPSRAPSPPPPRPLLTRVWPFCLRDQRPRIKRWWSWLIGAQTARNRCSSLKPRSPFESGPAIASAGG